MEETAQAIIRPARPGDHALIYSTWRNALWYAEKRDPKESSQFYKDTSEIIRGILSRPECRVRVACLSEDPDMLLGWSVFLADHLEFVYVKIDYRRKGLGRLLTKGFKTFSQPQTKIGKSLKEKHGRKEESQSQPQPA